MAKRKARGNGGDDADTLHETNRRLGRIEETLGTSSRLFELMHARLEGLEEGQTALVEGQKLVIERLDRLIDAATRDRTTLVERVAVMERRVEQIEHRLANEP